MTVRRNHKAVSALVAAGAAVASVAALSAPAQAGTKTYQDAVGDTRAVDITTVDIGYGTRLGVNMEHAGRSIDANSYFTFFINTDGKNPGPEYYVVVNPSSDGLFLYKTDDWGGGRVVPSPGLRAQAVIGNDDLAVRISVPAADIGKPKAVRVAVRSSQVTPNGVAKDWAAGAREFIPGWVARF